MSTNDPIVNPGITPGAPAGTSQKIFFQAVIALCGLAFLLALFQSWAYFHDEAQRVRQTKAHAATETDRVMRQLDLKFCTLMTLTQSLADRLSAGEIPNHKLLGELRTIMNRNPQVFALGVAFEPYAFRPDLEKYACYYVREKNGSLKLIDVAAIEDYLQDVPYEAWYHQPLKKGAMWMEPYYMPEVDASVVEYCVPFYRVDRVTKRKVPAGIVYIDYSFDDVKQIIDSLDLGRNGYGFIVSQTGRYISHPVADYVKEEKTIFDISREMKNQELQKAGAGISQRRPGIFQLKNEVNGQLSWLLTQPFPSTGWSLGVYFIKSEENAEILKQRRQLIRLVIAIMAFLIFLTLVVFFARSNPAGSMGAQRRWPVTVTIIFILLAGLGFIWTIAMRYIPNQAGNPITSRADLDKFKEATTAAAVKRREKAPVYIPTGIYIQSLEFDNANNVKLTGYIWQKYPQNIGKDILRGLTFPEQVAGSIDSPVFIQEDGMELARSNFEVTLRQEFDYSRYPFDTKDVRIQIWPKSFTGSVILVPDLDAYELIHPATRPGVAPNIVLAGWTLESSFFNYENNSYPSNFGSAKDQKPKNFPDLYFTLVLKRDFMMPFIVNLLPLGVILSILFALLLMGSKEKSKPDSFGISTSEVVGSCSGLLFSVIVAHSELRSDIPVREIIFIEYFYLLVYCMIILVAVNSFLFNAAKNIRVIDYEDNIIPKLAYWPLALVVMIGVSLAIFY